MRLRAKQSLQRIEITVYSPAIRLLLNLQKLPSSKKLSVLLIYCTKVPEKVILLSRWTDNILPSGGFRRMVSRLLLLVDTEGQSYPKDKMAFNAESEFESTRQVLTKQKSQLASSSPISYKSRLVQNVYTSGQKIIIIQ